MYCPSSQNQLFLPRYDKVQQHIHSQAHLSYVSIKGTDNQQECMQKHLLRNDLIIPKTVQQNACILIAQRGLPCVAGSYILAFVQKTANSLAPGRNKYPLMRYTKQKMKV